MTGPSAENVAENKAESETANVEKANWGSLLDGLKKLVIGYMDRDTRTALKMCSRDDKRLVENVKMRVLPHCLIENPNTNIDSGFRAEMKNKNSIHYAPTFKEMKQYDCIDNLTIRFSKKMTIRGYYLKAYHVVINLKTEDVITALRQIDPAYLKTLKIVIMDGQMKGTSTLYDLPQIRKAERLSIIPNYVTDKQLEKLEARSLNLTNSLRLTQKGVNSYLKKNIRDLHKAPLEFTIDVTEKEIFHLRLLCDRVNYRAHILTPNVHFLTLESPFDNFRIQCTLTDTRMKGRRLARKNDSRAFEPEEIENSCVGPFQ